MAFLGEDDDAMRAFEEVLSFVDDFVSDQNERSTTVESAAAGMPPPAAHQLEIASEPPVKGVESTCSALGTGLQTTYRPPRFLEESNDGGNTKMTAARPVAEAVRASQRAAENARKRLLRKAGVYANPNRARNERRLEIAYLREKVEQLETELGRLKDHSEHALTVVPNRDEAVGVDDGPASESQTGDTTVLGIWKGLAARQKSRREKAERENVRLKLIVESQIKIAKSLESLLLKRAQQQASECSSIHTPGGTPSRMVDFQADAADFQELLGLLDIAYRDVDAMLEGNGLARMELTQQDVHMREGVDEMYLEVFSNKVMPFGLHTTAEATWNHFKGSKKHRGNLYTKATQNLETPDTIVEHFTKELFAGNSSTDVHVKQVVRRYVEAERVVIVWVATITPVEIKRKTFKPFTGLTSHHRNFAIIKRAKASTAEQELSLLQLVSHASLDMKEGTIYDPKFIRALTDFLLSNAARNIKADQELIENLLMDQTLQ